MEKNKLDGSYNLEENKIILSFENEQSLEINMENDIDFTVFIQRLTLLVDTEKEIEITLEDTEEPKLKLVYDTILEIIETYNLTVKDFKEAQVLSTHEN